MTITPATGETGLAVLGATTVAAVAGLATFDNIALNRSGSYALRAAAAGLTDATSSVFAVQLAQLARYCPGDAGARASFARFRDALDATAAGGTIAICDGVHTWTGVINRAVTIVPENDGMAR